MHAWSLCLDDRPGISVGKDENGQEWFGPMWAKDNEKGKSRRGGEQRVAITVDQECSKWNREDRKVPASDNSVSCQKSIWKRRQDYAIYTYCDYASLTVTWESYFLAKGPFSGLSG